LYGYTLSCKARIRLESEIEIGLKFNQLEERKPISSLIRALSELATVENEMQFSTVIGQFS